MTYSKYRNKKVVYDGIRFDSIKEKDRYQELKLLEKAGHITDLRLQERFDLRVNGVKLGFYKADFSYYNFGSGTTVVEDSKGYDGGTPVYKLKKKLMKALHGIDIYET